MLMCTYRIYNTVVLSGDVQVLKGFRKRNPVSLIPTLNRYKTIFSSCAERQTSEQDLSAENINSVLKTYLSSSLLSLHCFSLNPLRVFGLSRVADTAAGFVLFFCTTCTFLYVLAVAHVEECHLGGKPLNHSGGPRAGQEL